MSTSVMVAYRDPNRREPFVFNRAACFGTMNRLSQATDQMEVMEWHPTSRGTPNASLNNTCTPRKAFNFVNSFGMWEDIFRVTPINTVAATTTDHPIDAIITGFMTMRDYQQRYNTRLFANGELDEKMEFALWSSGIYRNRYGTPALELGSVSHGEGGVCSLPSNTDAFALYLLVYGSKADFEGCWSQGILGQGANREGYVRDSSGTERQRQIRQSRPEWNGLASWLRAWLPTRPERHVDKLGRLTIHNFFTGLIARLNAEPQANRQRQADIITLAFEQLRDMYL